MGHKLSTKLMVVIVIFGVASCASLSGASIHDVDNQLIDKRKITNSSHDLNAANNSKSLSSSSASNETSVSKHEKKMIHRLIGGHFKLNPKVIEAKDERETPPVAETTEPSSTWDDGIMMSSAGNGKEKHSTTASGNRRDDDDEEKKTLSQQVKEGKYGLIQNEIYPTPPKRPGIISYLDNPEVPRDNGKNYGGLEEEEIWLAENHLLVLRGGNFPDHGTKPVNNQAKWPPIDDYKAPPRQVKIPERPEVPPPFPVQLTEGGPVQIFRANGSVANINETTDYEDYANYPEGFYPGEAPFYPFTSNATELGSGFAGNFTIDGNGTYLPAFTGSPVQGTVGPFYPALPPGAVFLPPPNNQSDYEDEDQSIYYPPPYSFYYKKDNTSAVPAGPLVPGIILPPPPNFFSSLTDDKNIFEKIQPTTTTKTTTEATTEETSTYPPYTPTFTPRRKTTVTKPYKVRFSPTTTTTTTQTTPTFVTRTRPTSRVQQKLKNEVLTKSREFTTTLPPRTTTRSFASTPLYVETTTSRPDKPTTITAHGDYYDVQTEVENHLVDLGEPQSGPWSAIVATTAVPLLGYYATTASSPLERTRSTLETADELSPIHVKAKIPSNNNQASYYFYEETIAKTTTNSPPIYYKTSSSNTNEPSPYYNVEPITTQRQSKKQYYSVEMIPSQQTANDYDIKYSSLIKNGQNYNTQPSKYNVERFRTQSDNDARYYQPITITNSGPGTAATIKPYNYNTTPRPRFYYETSQSENQYDYRDDHRQVEVKSNPVYQYSYESTDYSNKRHRQRYQHQQQQQQQQQPQPQQEISEEPSIYNDYQQPTSNLNGNYYDYDTQPIVKVEEKTSRIPSYLGTRVSSNSGSYSNSRGVSILNTTPNPHHAYYTKQDEQLLDDVTKQYFTIFGKKLPENGGLQSTTPLYRLVSTTTENPISHNVNSYVSNNYNNAVEEQQLPVLQTLKPIKVKVHYGDQTQRPYSLEGDTLVNYKNPLPPIDPDAEFISIPDKPNVGGAGPNSLQGSPGYGTEHVSPIADRPNDNYVPASNPRETYRGRYNNANPPISLANDIGVNYRNPRPPINPDAEFIDPVQGQGNQAIRGSGKGGGGGGGGSYFAYQLPGNGGHFYFLTPRAIPQRRDREYNIYPKPTAPRIIRRRRGPTDG